MSPRRAIPPDQTSSAPPAPLAGRDRLVSVALLVGLTLAYSANGTFLPGNDATPNLHLAAKVLEGEGLSFTPSEDPRLFDWVLLTPAGPKDVTLFDLGSRMGGRPARELYRAGALVPFSPYYLRETIRRDPATGEPSFVGLYGVGAALSALPVLAVARAFAGDLSEAPAALFFGGKLAASLLAAASAALLYLLFRRWAGPGWALVLALAYGLGTSVWSTSSQALWQHASNELFLAAGALFLAGAGERRRDAVLAGAALAAATACRPTSALFALAAAAYLLAADRRSLLPFVAGALPLAVSIAAYNAYFLGSPFTFGQGAASDVALAKTGSPELWRPDLAGEALAGLVLSPSRGLLVFSPFLALSFAGAVLVWRREAYRPLRPLVLGGALVLAVDVAWFDWWGGWTYGWRRLVDLAPVLVALLLPVIPWLERARWRRVAFALALAWAVLLQLVGAFAYDLGGWNAREGWALRHPTGAVRATADEGEIREALAAGAIALGPVRLDVDLPEHRHRLWSLRDSAIVYYVTHFSDARRSRRARVDAWIEAFTPPPAAGG